MKLKNRKLFFKAQTAIEDCADVIIKNNEGVILEIGMNLGDDVFFTHALDKGTIRLYKRSNLIVEFGSDDAPLPAFKELLEQIGEI